ncbi:hypothetical protein HDU86_001165 [Geranomyces michiganensis]|nr:hypothetical protein HDU86_001165 [Geranomyces michiganensis]
MSSLSLSLSLTPPSPLQLVQTQAAPLPPNYTDCTFTFIEFVALVHEPFGYGHKAWTIRIERQLYEGSALAPVPAASSLFVSATSVFVSRHETLKDGVNLLFRPVPEIQIHRFA